MNFTPIDNNGTVDGFCLIKSLDKKTSSKGDTYLDEIKVCTGYEIDGKVTKDFPVTGLLEKAKPVLTTLPGWKCDITGITEYNKLPENCRKYIEFIEQEIGFKIHMVSNGPARENIIIKE